MKDILKRILIGISTFILILVMFIFIDINEIVNNLSKISIYGIFLFIIIYTGVFILRTLRLKLIFRGLFLNASFLTLFGSFGIGWAINELTPGKIGDIARIEVIYEKEKKISMSSSLCGIGTERLIDIIILFSITCVALFYMYLNNIGGPSAINLRFYIGIGVILLFGIVIVLILLFLKTNWILNITGKFSMKLRKLLEGFLKNFLREINTFRKNKKIIIGVTFISFPIWLLETLTLTILFYLIGFEINIFIIILSQIVLFFSKTFPITPGGWVVSENVGSLLIILFYPSIPYNNVLFIFILDHILRTSYVLIFGILSSFLLNFKLKKIDLKQLDENNKKREKNCKNIKI